jgi:hypothetical protein
VSANTSNLSRRGILRLAASTAVMRTGIGNPKILAAPPVEAIMSVAAAPESHKAVGLVMRLAYMLRKERPFYGYLSEFFFDLFSDDGDLANGVKKIINADYAGEFDKSAYEYLEILRAGLDGFSEIANSQDEFAEMLGQDPELIAESLDAVGCSSHFVEILKNIPTKLGALFGTNVSLRTYAKLSMD